MDTHDRENTGEGRIFNGETGSLESGSLEKVGDESLEQLFEQGSSGEERGEKKRGGSLLSRIRDKARIGDKKELAPTDDDAKVITARGTEDGLVLRIDGKATWDLVKGELEQFLGSRRRFLEGGEVSIEWLERLPTPEQSFELEQFLREGYGVEVVSRRRRPAFTTIVDRSRGKAREEKSPKTQNDLRLAEDIGQDDHYEEGQRSTGEVRDGRIERVLRDTIEILEDSGSPSYLRRVSKMLGEDLVYDEDANAKIVFGTFRSGQRLETPYSLVVVGDVNPGADLIAGGDIFVLGSLRGTAHAAAYDDEAFDRVIVALQMQPVQLRIGSILSRGNEDAARGPEVARVENRRIIVEGFNSRTPLRKRAT